MTEQFLFGAIWKIIYNYAIDDISDLITSNTTVEDFETFIIFPVERNLATVLYNRILIACVKCGNDVLLNYNIYSDLSRRCSIYSCRRIVFIACEYGHKNIISYFNLPNILSIDEIMELLIISLKNLHFEISTFLYNLYPHQLDRISSVNESLSICDSKDKEKILEFARKEWNYII